MGAEIGAVKVEPGLKSVRTYENGEPVKGLTEHSPEMKMSVLIQNKTNSYKFVPKWIALAMVKSHDAVFVEPRHPDYVKGVQMALGRAEGFKPGDMIQVGGKAIAAEQIGILNVDAIIKAAEEAAEDYEGRKESGELEDREIPADPQTFDGKNER